MFDPISGFNAPGYRFLFNSRAIFRHPLWLPISMKSLPEVKSLLHGISPLLALRASSLREARLKFNNIRLDHDFAFWGAYVCRIPDRHNPDNVVPLILNPYQHKVIDTILHRREQKMTGRYIITKSIPKIGLTTVIQTYIFWAQTHIWKGNSYTAVPKPILNRSIKANLLRNLFTQSRVLSNNSPLSPSDMDDVRWYRFDTERHTIVVHNQPRYRAHFGSISDIHRARAIHFDYVHFPDLGSYTDISGFNIPDCYRSAAGSIDIDPECLFVMEGDTTSIRNLFFLREIRASYSKRSLFFPIRL